MLPPSKLEVAPVLVVEMNLPEFGAEYIEVHSFTHS